MYACCATLLSNGLVGSVCGQAGSSDQRSMACRPNGKGTGEDGVLSDVVPALFILPGLKSVFLQAFNPDMHGDRPPATQHTSRHRPSPDLAARANRAYRQPDNMQPDTPSVITD